jgi:hypothetical protein
MKKIKNKMHKRLPVNNFIILFMIKVTVFYLFAKKYTILLILLINSV